jgi:hypothetical protein
MQDQDLVKRLRSGQYGASAAEIIDLATRAVQAQESLSQASRGPWLRDQGISSSVWSKLITIGSATGLRAPGRMQRLPANFSTLVLIARCSEAELNQMEREGLIHPSVSFRTIEAWRRSRNKKPSAKTKVQCSVLPYVIAADNQLDPLDELSLINAVVDFIHKLPVQAELVRCERESLRKTEGKVREQWIQGCIDREASKLNKQTELNVITDDSIKKSIGEFKKALPALQPDEILTAYSIKHAYDYLTSESKDQRYFGKQKVREIADQGNDTALRLMEALECQVAY